MIKLQYIATRKENKVKLHNERVEKNGFESMGEKVMDERKEKFRKMIIEMVSKIDDEKFLRRIYIIISDNTRQKAE